MRKIFLGGHWAKNPGWEIYNQAQIDITKKLPFEDNSIDYVMSEHTLEHIIFTEIIFHLRECLRILKTGGIVRIVMPMIDNLCYSEIDNSLGEIYFKNNISHLFESENKELNTIGLDISDFKKEFQINGLFFKCGHRFIWSSDLFKKVLQKVGFSKVVKFIAGYGNIPENCIEHHQRGIDMSMDYEKNMTIKNCYDIEGYAVEGIK